MKHAVIGILAHVDAGKTTLSEDLLFRTGAIRKKGSVDSGDTVMDSNAIEAERGITIYSSEAVIRTDAMELQLIDTPGHVDFSGEAERALSVLDCAILVLSGSEGVQSHTRTLWDLLRRHHIPTFIFVNKMDIAHESASDLLRQMKTELSDGITDFTDLFQSGRGGEASGSRKTEEYLSGELAEELASCHEDLLNEYMETETLKKASVTEIIGEGLIFPTIFGSARNSQGTKELLSILEEYMPVRKWPEEFGALCYKVDRDQKGNRLTYLKVTGGLLKARMEIGDEKINEIRTYVGERYETRQEVPAGELCAVTGLSESYSGQGLGIQEEQNSHELEPVFRYRVLPEGGVSSHTLLQALKELEEEDPLLDVAWDQKSDEIRISLMGPIQKEILATELRDKYQIEASFAESKVTYRETLRQPVEGHGHFEPLRHFADVWLRMEPLPAGSGISAVSECSTDELEENYQRQILRRLLSGRQTGVLMNADLTDVRFVLTHGKSHTKHTEGGDFRKATDLAVRDALIHGMGQVLEPYYKVRLTVPLDKMGRAMTDLTNMHGSVETPVTQGTNCLIEGLVPVTEIADYQASVNAYTGGLGSLSLEPGGYLPCHNEDEVIEDAGYNYRTDPAHPYISVYVHQEVAPPDPSLDGRKGSPSPYGFDPASAGYEKRSDQPMRDASGRLIGNGYGGPREEKEYQGYGGLENDLQEIFERTYGKIERKDLGQSLVIEAEEKQARETTEEAKASYLAAHPNRKAKQESKQMSRKKKYILVDCYNLIFQWPKLRDLMNINTDSARGRLLDILSNYQGYIGAEVIAVFDAYKVKGNPGSVMDYHNIHVVYTREAQTADAYIERTTHEIMHGGDADITVVTSDGLEQMIVIGEGATRISSREFIHEVDRVNREGQESYT